MQTDASIRTVHGACPHDCPDTCAMEVHVKGEQVVKVVGRADHPSTHGALCTKVSRYPERTHHPDRLLTPLRRTSKKTEPPRFEPMAWDEALRTIAAKFHAIEDKQTIQPYSYAGTMGLLQGGSMAERLWNRLGAARLDRTICASAGAAGLTAVYGNRIGMHLRHFAQAKLIVIWGSNSIASNLHFWTYANAAKRDGARLVCIDPRRTETADKCHQHLALRPGSDGALALALMHELIVHGWLDEGYIERAVEGFAGLRERALAWSPERAAPITGLEADDIRALAHEYAHTRPAAIRLNYGIAPLFGGRLARARGRLAAQQFWLGHSVHQQDGLGAARPVARAAAAQRQHEHPGRRAAASAAAHTGACGLQQQPSGGGA
jgi:anaerobic selenocysteine-containing dehydrogenase